MFYSYTLCALAVPVDVVIDNEAVRISVSLFKNKPSVHRLPLTQTGVVGGIGAQVLMYFFKYFFKIYKYD